jgi:ABC-type nitrate/sulfonate/bicarbonate transport system substrate-binding protein
MATKKPTDAVTTLKIIVFPNTTVLPLYVGETMGFFAKQGLAIERTITPTSTFQITKLAAGEFDIAIGAFDNIVAYQEGQGAEILKNPDLFAFMGVARMNLQLVVQPGIQSYADLKGKTLAVDAVSSGFVSVLRRMLELGGLGLEDYELVPVGTRRWETMKAGDHAGALMTDNFMSGDLSTGLRILDNSIDALPPYQSAVGSACRGWAAAHKDELIRFIRAYVACLDWIFDPAHHDEAARILADNRDGMSAQAAAKSVAQLVSGREGLTPKAVLDMVAVQTVIDLRNRFGEPRKELAGPAPYVDLSYYQAAMST